MSTILMFIMYSDYQLGQKYNVYYQHWFCIRETFLDLVLDWNELHDVFSCFSLSLWLSLPFVNPFMSHLNWGEFIFNIEKYKYKGKVSLLIEVKVRENDV